MESCNLVAITCNENEYTLTNKKFDGFDVVIIVLRAEAGRGAGDRRRVRERQERDHAVAAAPEKREKELDTRHVIPFLTASRGSPDLQVPALATLLFVDQDCSCLQVNGSAVSPAV